MAAYNHKDIHQKGIVDKTNDQLDLIDAEASTVENNISIISDQAAKTEKTLSKLQVPLDLGKFRTLVADLRLVLRMIHKIVESQRAVNSEKDRNKRKALSAKLKAYDPPLPAIFSNPAAEDLGTLCPLMVYLQAVSSSLTTLKIKRITGGMGTARAIIGLLEAMGPKLTNANPSGEQCHGLANCLMIHEKNSRFIVFGTAPCYRRLHGLRDFAWETRERNLMRLKAKMPEAELHRLEITENVSKQIWEDTRAGNKPTQPPNGYTRLVIVAQTCPSRPRASIKPHA